MTQRFFQRLDPAAQSHSFRPFTNTLYAQLGGEGLLQWAIHDNLNICLDRLVSNNPKGAVVAVTVNQPSLQQLVLYHPGTACNRSELGPLQGLSEEYSDNGCVEGSSSIK